MPSEGSVEFLEGGIVMPFEHGEADLLRRLKRVESEKAMPRQSEGRELLFRTLVNYEGHDDWLYACKLAVIRGEEEFLRRHATDAEVEELPWFLQVLHAKHRSYAEPPLTSRARVAQCIAGAALCALQIKSVTSSFPGDDQQISLL